MKIAVMGTGGVGGYYGGRLAQGGENVTFIARGAHLEAMRENGLKVMTSEGDFAVRPIQATDKPDEAGEVDLVVVATKTYALDDAARAILPMVGKDTLVLPLLNGVDIANRLGAIVGMARMLGGLCYVSSAIVEPGVVRQRGPLDGILIGELSGEKTHRLQAVYDVMKGAGLKVELSYHIQKEILEQVHFHCRGERCLRLDRCHHGAGLGGPRYAYPLSGLPGGGRCTCP